MSDIETPDVDPTDDQPQKDVAEAEAAPEAADEWPDSDDISDAQEVRQASAGLRYDKKKVAVLGGGVGSMVAALELTGYPGWEDRFDVTVYQMGWRLGGKGASGRSREMADRIEEHGLHMWFGSYENAFRLMRLTYEELGRNPNWPMATVWDAFKPYPFLGVMQAFETRTGKAVNAFKTDEYDPELLEWTTWIEYWATDPHLPGTGEEFLHPWHMVAELLGLLVSALATTPIGPAQGAPPMGGPAGQFTQNVRPTDTRYSSAVDAAEQVVGSAVADVARLALTGAAAVTSLLTPGLGSTKVTPRSPIRSSAELDAALHQGRHWVKEGKQNVDKVLQLIIDVRKWIWSQLKDIAELSRQLYRLWLITDLICTIGIGMIADGVVEDGWDVIDDVDLRKWLGDHGAQPDTVNSPLTKGAYDFVFAYSEGDQKKPSLAAGSILRFMMRMVLEYKGSIAWSMEAGMGDTVFAPMYEVLRRRGVKFEYFTKVTALHLDEGGTDVESIDFERQVQVKPKKDRPGVPSSVGDDEYWPLYDVRGLPCWPDRPDFDQLVDGAKLEKGWKTAKTNYNLESHWNNWPHGKTGTLTRGKDFDLVVYGLSLGPVEFVCKELFDKDAPEGSAKRKWWEMLDNVETVTTQSLQLWFRPSLENLGWPGSAAVVDAFTWPMSTYCDLTHLIPMEKWPETQDYPGALGYFCGNFSNQEMPPASEFDFPAKMYEETKRQSTEWLRKTPSAFWPDAMSTNQPTQLNWDLLVDLDQKQGEERLDTQWFRCNIDPSERYVLTTPGTNRYRLHPGESGYKNLYLAGDWTWNPLNTGCVEGATMSGQLCARAMSGFPIKIYGENIINEGESVDPGPLHVTGGYDGVLMSFWLPAAELASLLPKHEALDSNVELDGMYPVILATGQRLNAHFTFPDVFTETYGECMFIVPQLVDATGSRKGGACYPKEVMLSSPRVTAGARAIWGWSTRPVTFKYGQEGPGRGERWDVRSVPGGNMAAEVDFSPIEDAPDTAAHARDQLHAWLSQPWLCKSLAGFGPQTLAALDWGFKSASVVPVRAQATLSASFAGRRFTVSTDDPVGINPLHRVHAFRLSQADWHLSMPDV